LPEKAEGFTNRSSPLEFILSQSKDALHLNIPYQVRDKLLNSLMKSVFFNTLLKHGHRFLSDFNP